MSHTWKHRDCLAPTFPEISSAGRWRRGLACPFQVHHGSLQSLLEALGCHVWLGSAKDTAWSQLEALRGWKNWFRAFSCQAVENSEHRWNQPRLYPCKWHNRTVALPTSSLKGLKAQLAPHLLLESTEKQWQRQCWSCQFQVDLRQCPVDDPSARAQLNPRRVWPWISSSSLFCAAEMIFCWDSVCQSPDTTLCIDTVLKGALLQWSRPYLQSIYP